MTTFETFHLATDNTDKNPDFKIRVIRGSESDVCEPADDLAAFISGLLLRA